MKIQSIEAIPVRIPLKPERRMISALGRHEVSNYVIVKLTTDTGIVGVGEATVMPRWSGETVWGSFGMIQHLMAPVLVGCDLKDLPEIVRRLDAVTLDNWFSKAAVEMACWDALGIEAGKPIYELLGGAVRPLTIRNRFSVGAYTPEITAARASQLVADGFTTIKVKVGTDVVQDVERIKAVRAAIGPQITLTIDANGGWNEAQARECLTHMADQNIDLVEQPLWRGNYTGLRALRKDLGVRILADESCFDEIEAIELIQQECCDAITLYPGKQGGIGKAIRLAELAGRHAIPCTIGSNLEWDIGAAAMMHFIVASKNMQVESIPGDCLGPTYHEFSIAKNPLKFEGPLTTISASPGLGVSVDWEKVEQHRLWR